MKSSGRGYTILEVMLFLAISSALFVSAYLLVGGQQPKTQFSQGMRDVESKLRDYMNDVSTGYYPQVGEFTCGVNGLTGEVEFTSNAGGGDSTGTNLSCIFLGKAIQVQPEEGNDVINVYSVVGKRKTTISGMSLDVSTLAEATPTAVYDTGISLDKTERFDIPWGVKVRSVVGQPTTSARMIGIYSSVTPGQNESGAMVLQPLIYNNIGIGESKDDAVSCINTTSSCTIIAQTFTEWTLCFERADAQETAQITIGGDGKKTNLKLEFKECS